MCVAVATGAGSSWAASCFPRNRNKNTASAARKSTPVEAITRLFFRVRHSFDIHVHDSSRLVIKCRLVLMMARSLGALHSAARKERINLFVPESNHSLWRTHKKRSITSNLLFSALLRDKTLVRLYNERERIVSSRPDDNEIKRRNADVNRTEKKAKRHASISRSVSLVGISFHPADVSICIFRLFHAAARAPLPMRRPSRQITQDNKRSDAA